MTDLEKVLRDHTIIVPQDAAVFVRIGEAAFSAAEPPHSDTPPCFCRECREKT